MRLTTWNVNGIRNPFSYQPWNSARTFPAMFDILESDIVVMQELKIQRKDLRDDMVLLDGWDCYFSLPKLKKGYSGVAIYTRNATCAPIKAEEGLLGILPSQSGVPYRELPAEESIGGYPNESQVASLSVDLAALDAEGRCVVLEFPAFVLFGVYAPANSNGLRDDFRYWFIHILDCRIRNLIKEGKRVVLVGDLNVSRDELDAASAAEDIKKSGLTHEEYISTPNRRIFNQMLVGGEVVGDRDIGREMGVLVDTTRAFHPNRRGMYTHWEQKINARPGNFGGRIDFVLIVESMLSWVQDANIQEGLLGSDHCPVFVDFRDIVDTTNGQVHIRDIMNTKGVFEQGLRQKDWSSAYAPAFSAKRLPEFDKRRSIRSMFSAPLLSAQPHRQELEQSLDKSQPVLSPKSPISKASTLNQAQQSPLKSPVTAYKFTNNGIKRKLSSHEDHPTKLPDLDSQTKKIKGQQSLKNFFRAPHSNREIRTSVQERSVASNLLLELGSDRAIDSKSIHRMRSTTAEDVPKKSCGTEYFGNIENSDTVADVAAQSQSNSPSPRVIESQFATIEENQRSWGSLFARPPAPLCESHNEPCKTMQTKKKGSNQGRSFWMCARPLGPSGNKERGTQWRCPTFIWCSDWDGKREKERVENHDK